MTVYSAYTDMELVDLLKQDDHFAYTEIFLRYNRLLYGHAFKKLQNREESQDVVQDVFAALWLKRDVVQIKSNLAGYLYVALRNKIYNLMSHKEVEADYVVSLQQYIKEEYAITDHLIRAKQLEEIIAKEMSALPPRMREIFELSRKKYLSHKEIALQLNITESTVTDQVKKALKILKPRIGLMLYMMYLLR